MRTASQLLRATTFAWSLVAGSTALPAAATETTFDVSVLAAACANCHGPDGRSPGAIPTIAGRPENILLKQLKAFKSDNPPAGTTIMDRLTAGCNDDQLAALARRSGERRIG